MKVLERTGAMVLTLLASLAIQLPATEARPMAPAPQQSQLDRGRSALHDQDYATAMNLLAPLAREGQMEAQSLVAYLNQKGYGVDQDLQEALRLYTLSALQGWGDALFTLGQMYYGGEGVAEDLKSAADLFLLCAITGDADGQWAIGVCFTRGEGRAQDPIEGGAWLKLAADQGQEHALQELVELKGKLSEEDFSIAAEVAAQFDQMIRNGEFDAAKMPKVPIPANLSLDTPTQPTAPQDPAVDANNGVVQAKMHVAAELLPTGDIRGRVELRFPEELYSQMKQAVLDPRLFMRDLRPARANAEIAPDSTARYDDAENAVVIDLHMLGAVRNLGEGRWEWEPDQQTFSGTESDGPGREIAIFEIDEAVPDEGFALVGQARYTLPEGATEIRWNETEKTISYRLPYTGPTGKGRFRVSFDVRERLMSCLYKVYGLEDGLPAQWVAKAVFTNTGEGPLTDLAVRFKLGSYSELDLWHKFPEVVPGQTVVVTYHPVLNRRIAELTSTTPTNLIAEWEYVDAEGEEHEDGDGGRISILGRHEFVFSNLLEDESLGTFDDAFSNAELLAAWVNRDDPIVKQFAAAANKAAGGEGAPYSDEAAWKVLKACYELWQANDFTYQGPTGFTDENLSFDNKIVQSVKFPRDVIRDRSGTCIELAALYCSMAQAVGLQSYMVLVPGHAFPLIQLPSGNYLPVESTGVGGGKRHGTASFEQVVEAATKTYQQNAEAGTLIEVDVQRAWSRGISNPELEAVPADILNRWKMVLSFTLSSDSGRAVDHTSGPVQPTAPVQPTNPVQPPPTTPPSSGTFIGSWSGSVKQPLLDGSSLTWTTTLEIRTGRNGTLEADLSAQVRVPNGWGGEDTYQVNESLEGRPGRGNTLTLKGTKKTTFVNGQATQDFPDTLSLTLRDGQLRGTLQLADGSRLELTARR